MMPDHPRKFIELIVDTTPTIARHGPTITMTFDSPEQADGAHRLLWRAIESLPLPFKGHDAQAEPTREE
jgi:hypothetical protein